MIHTRNHSGKHGFGRRQRLGPPSGVEDRFPGTFVEVVIYPFVIVSAISPLACLRHLSPICDRDPEQTGAQAAVQASDALTLNDVEDGLPR
jgi:hypothetical protein